MKTFESYQSWAVGKLGGQQVEFACALGIVGEAGEVADLLKKHLCHGLPLDRDKLTKKLGDVLYYVAAVAHQYHIPLDRVAAENVSKLEARYPNGFSTEAAAARADECPPTWPTGAGPQ